jgi:hypothetical protein
LAADYGGGLSRKTKALPGLVCCLSRQMRPLTLPVKVNQRFQLMLRRNDALTSGAEGGKLGIFSTKL